MGDGKSMGLLEKLFQRNNLTIGDCHRDFDENAPAIQKDLLDNRQFLVYPICGSYTPDLRNSIFEGGLSAMISLLTLGDQNYTTLFHVPACAVNEVPPTDVIVPMYSQKSGENITSTFASTAHSNTKSTETTNVLIQAKVIALLADNDPKDF